MSEDRLAQIVIAKTKDGSRHQRAALQMLAKRLERYRYEIKPVKCDECGNTLECVHWTDQRTGKTVDTWGYLEADTNICHHCLKEGYIGDILVHASEH